MEVRLSQEYPLWPALWRLALRLGLQPRLTDRPPACGSVAGVLRELFSRTPPRRWPLLFPALTEYWICRFHLQAVGRQAAAATNRQNHILVAHILRRHRANLAREMPGDWSELTGLSIQKLLHLTYYEEMAERAD
jgi:hypothetical protein